MNKNYYKEYYVWERNHWWFLARAKILNTLTKTMISDKANRKLKILNVGIATGASTQMLEEFGEVTSVEYDKDCCTFLKEDVGIEVINASLLDLPFDANSFDLVCCFDVIEHIEDEKGAAKEIKRVLKEGGYTFITVPAFMFLWSHHDDVNHHFRRYTLSSLNDLFSSTKLKLEYKSYFNSILFIPIVLFRLVAKLFNLRGEKKESTGSDFEIANGSKIVNWLLQKVFHFESYFLKRRISFPCGVSAMAIYKK